MRVAAGAGLIVFRADVLAQPQRKVVQIGYLSPGYAQASVHTRQAFVQGMHGLGYAEGENLIISYRYAEGIVERLSELAAELIQMKPDLIFASTSQAAHAARDATATIPIVMVGAADPIGQGFAASLARPGGNITGISGQYEDIVQKMLELLKSAVPKASRIALLVNVNPASPLHGKNLKASLDAAQALGLRAWSVEVQGPSDLDGAFAAIGQEHPDALMHMPDPLFFGERKRIADFAAKNRLPAIGPWREFAEAGGLMSYGYDLAESFAKAANYVDKILKGAKPGDLPIEQPTKFELIVNLKTAKAIGLTIPPSFLLRADEVIQW